MHVKNLMKNLQAIPQKESLSLQDMQISKVQRGRLLSSREAVMGMKRRHD